MIEVFVEDEAWVAVLTDAETLAEQAARAAAPDDREIAVLLSSDAHVQALNLQFRGKDAPTNVLSFPSSPDNGQMGGDHLGDVILAYGVCAREAAAQDKSLAAHLQHLVAHGVLHLVGYDHEDDADAEAMEAKEREILAGLGLPDPYE